MSRIEFLRRRDGQLEPFQPGRLAEEILAAVREGGEEPAPVAAELAGVVALFLEKDFQDAIPGEEDVLRTVERVLRATGHERTADAWRATGQRRVALAGAVPGAQAAAPAAAERPEAPPALQVHAESGDHLLPWSRARIVRALEAEAELPHEQAEEVARAVERRVARSGLRRISTALIRELVDGELFERGFAASLARQKVIGIPKFDLEGLLRGAGRAGGAPASLREAVAGQVLRRYALEEIFSAPVARAHLEERLHLHGLEDPLRLEASAHSLEHLKRFGLFVGEGGAAAAPARRPRSLSGQVIALLASLGEYVSGLLALPLLNVFYAPFLEGVEDAELRQEAQHLIFTVSQLGLPSGCRPAFHLHAGVPAFLHRVPAVGPGGAPTGRVYGDYGFTAGRFARALLEVLRDGDGEGRSFARPECLLHLEPGAAGAAGELLELAGEVAARRGEPRFLFDREALWLAPGCLWDLPGGRPEFLEQPHRLRRFLLQRVTLNLPAAARAVGDPDRLFARLGEDLALAVRACVERRAFTARLLSGPGLPLWGLGRLALDGEPYVNLERASCLVGVHGLNECVRLLTGEELHQGERALALGLRILSFLRFTARDRGREAGLDCRLGETPPGRELRRLQAEGEGGPAVCAGGASLPLGAGLAAPEWLRRQGRLHRLLDGGACALLPAAGGPRPAAAVRELLREAAEHTGIGQLVFAVEPACCRRCGAVSPSWVERCPDCGAPDVRALTPPAPAAGAAAPGEAGA